jgi:BirA family biotin operon repressor/biotin-[acetyl-CoA-carboxylase] ligase
LNKSPFSPLVTPSFYVHALQDEWIIIGSTSILYSMFDQFCSYHYPILDSTSKHAKRWLRHWKQDAVTLISADTQTHGYGRLGRQWSSPKCNLHCTYLYPVPQLPRYAPNVAQIAALAAAKAITATCNLNIDLKWPNDLMIQGQKLGGILVEAATVDASCSFLIIGIGLNVNSTAEQLAAVGQPATSLLIATNQQQCRTTLVHNLTNHLLDAMKTLHKHGFEYFHTEYTQLLIHRTGDILPYKKGKNSSCGNYYGIAADGALMLTDSNEQIVLLYSSHES